MVVKSILSQDLTMTKGEAVSNELNCQIRELETVNLSLQTKLESYNFFQNISNSWESYWDYAGNLQFISPTVEKITGFDGSEFLNGQIEFINLVHQDDQQILLEKFIHQNKQEEIPAFAIRIFDKQKNLKHLALSSRPVFDENNHFIGSCTTCIDITLTVQNSQRLKENEQLYSDIFEKNSAVKLLIDKSNGKIIDANSAAVLFYGFSRDHLKSMYISDVEVKSNKKTQPELTDTSLEEHSFFETKHRLSNGLIRNIEVYSSPVNHEDRTLVHLIIHDITKRKKSEKKLKQSEANYKTLIDNTPDMIVRFDSNLRHTFVNHVVEKISGKPSESFIGKTHRELGNLTIEQIEYSEKLIREVFNTGKPLSFEISMPSTHGEIHLLSRGVPEFDKQGNVKGALFIHRDISIRKNFEKVLQNNELNMQALFDTMAEGVSLNEMIFDEEGVMIDYRVLNVNKAFYYTADYQGQDVIGKVATELYGMSTEFIKAFYFEHRHQQKTVITELLSPLGNKWHSIATSPFLNNKFVTTFFDITERKRAEDQLRESESRLNRIIEATNVGTWEWNVQTGELSLNNRWAEIAGYSLEELAPVSIQTWFMLGHPEDLKKSGEQLELVFSKAILHYDLECRMKHKNGNWIWIHDRGKVFEWTSDGKPVKMSGTHTDITLRKQAEERLALLMREKQIILDSAPVGISLIIDRKQVWVNKKTEEMFLYGKEELENQTTIKLYPTQDAYNKFGEEAYQRLSRGEVYESVQELVRSDGAHIWASYIGKAIDPLDLKKGTLWILEDITARKASLEALEQSESRLWELNKTKDKLLSIIAHDLKNPFNSILGFSELLSENISNYEIDKSKKFANQINSATKSTLYLLENLLTWAKNQSGQIVFKPENSNLQSLINEIIELFYSSASIKNIRFEIAQSERIDFFADANMIKAILRNLISNAIKFSHPGDKITILTRKESGLIRVTVKDSGMGMSEEIKNKLFKIESNSTMIGTAKERGSGLGLIICKEFAEKHGGTIEVKTEAGKGSEFTLILPIA
jgi:PAS domain S-box-containing protein